MRGTRLARAARHRGQTFVLEDALSAVHGQEKSDFRGAELIVSSMLERARVVSRNRAGTRSRSTHFTDDAQLMRRTRLQRTPSWHTLDLPEPETCANHVRADGHRAVRFSFWSGHRAADVSNRDRTDTSCAGVHRQRARWAVDLF